MKQGTLNYREYKCLCGGRINRRNVSTITKGIFKIRTIYTYYYECNNCERISEYYEIDVTDRT